jgi:intracellular multiplication protein IcmB
MSLAKGLYRALNLPLESLSDLHGVDYGGAKNLRTEPLDAFLDSGGLIRYGVLQGDYSTLDPDLYQAMLRKLQEGLVTLFRSPGHTLDISFHVDPARSTEFLERRLAPYRRQAEKHGLDFGAIFDSRVAHFQQHIAPEVVIVALRTDPSILLANEQKRANEARKKRREQARLGDWIRGGQDVTAIMPELRHIHDQAWYTLVKSLDTCGNVLMDGQSRNNGLRLDALTIEQAIDWMRNIQRPGTYSLPDEKPTWKADLARPSLGVNGSLLATAPRLGLSAIPEEMEVVKGIVQTPQGMCFAPVIMSLGPVDAQPFEELLTNLVKANIPARVNFRLIPGGSGNLSLKKIGAEMLYLTTKMTDNGNGLVKESIAEIQRHANHDPVMLMRSVACTWAASEDQAQMQQQTLLRMIETWGNQECTTRCGDPVQTVLSSIPGLMSSIAAPAWPANLSDVLPLLPLDRPASPWTHGPFFLRDKLRKMLAVGHDLQTPIISFTGPPGRGKSMAMALQLLSYLWDAGQGDLPYISIIDVGYSSIEFIETVRQALGEKAYLAQGFTLSLNGKTINPFDTPLGFRFPTENHLSFLKNLIGIMCGNTNKDKSILKLPEAIGAAVLACYTSVSDLGQGKVKPYKPEVDLMVDAAIARHNILMDDHTSWWEIVDALFAKGDLTMAGRAQRFAVPVFLDLIKTCTADNDLKAKYGDLKVEGQMDLIPYINLSINEAAKNWPVMASPSTFDFGRARIVSLDLVEVTQGQDESSIRQSTAMYLLARFKTSQSFIFSQDDVEGARDHLRPEYVRYHTDRATQIKRDVKIAVWDELHRTGGLPQIPDQIERDGREGRKNGLRILLGSQSFRDIPDTIQDILGAAYVMGLDGKEIGTIVERTGIAPILAAKAVDHCIGPGDKGSGALVYWKREDRRYTSLSYVIAGPVELWALTTHPESRAVKKSILKEVPYSATLNLLGSRYPSGTIKKELERRKGLAEGGEDFLTEIAHEIVRMYQMSLLNSASPLQGANPH